MNPTTSAADWQSVVPVFGIEKQSTLAIYLSNGTVILNVPHLFGTNPPNYSQLLMQRITYPLTCASELTANLKLII